MDFVILAGGHGERFKKEGYNVPKPLLPIMGKPMIGRLIDTLMKCGAEHIYVGANSEMPELIGYLEELQKEGYPVETRPILTENSYSTLEASSERIKGRFIAITCDAIFPAEEFKKYVERVEATPEDEALMGLTRFVEDESPLYARVNKEGEVIDYRYGGEPFEEGEIVSVGLYGLSGKIIERIKKYNPQSLSDFQCLLASVTSIKVLPFEFSIAFDVDNTRDLEHAERYLQKQGKE